MQTSGVIDESNCVSAPHIADALGRDPVSHRCIKRRRIQPAFTLNDYNYYTRATLAKIAKGMRRKNACKENGNGQ